MNLRLSEINLSMVILLTLHGVTSLDLSAAITNCAANHLCISYSVPLISSPLY